MEAGTRLGRCTRWAPRHLRNRAVASCSGGAWAQHAAATRRHSRRGKGDAAAVATLSRQRAGADTRHAPGGLRAGDRAPDAVCVDRDGAPTRLFDRFRGTQFTLLAFGGAGTTASDAVRSVRVVDDRQAAGADDVVDVHGFARESYGMRSAGSYSCGPTATSGSSATRATSTATFSSLD